MGVNSMKKAKFVRVLVTAVSMLLLLIGCQLSDEAGDISPSPTDSATLEEVDDLLLQGEANLPRASWGDDTAGRSVYTRAEVADGALGENAVLNSLIDSLIQDSRYFIYAQRIEDGKASGPLSNSFAVKEGETYQVFMYVQNDNPGTVSLGTRAAISVPLLSQDGLCQLTGVIHSQNATTQEIWSTLVLSSEQDFQVGYVYGSARLMNSAYADGLELDDALVTKASSENGVMIGYEKMNGEMPGGEAYQAIVTIQIKIVAANVNDTSPA